MKMEFSLFYPQTTPDEFENAIGHFGFVVEDNSGREISLLSQYRDAISLEAPFSKCFPFPPV